MVQPESSCLCHHYQDHVAIRAWVTYLRITRMSSPLDSLIDKERACLRSEESSQALGSCTLPTFGQTISRVKLKSRWSFRVRLGSSIELEIIDTKMVRWKNLFSMGDNRDTHQFRDQMRRRMAPLPITCIIANSSSSSPPCFE